MNLIPVPRTLELSGDTVANRAPTRRPDPRLAPQGYELRITPDVVELAAADDEGFFYGQLTLAQLAAIHEGALPAGVVRDHPDLAVRGVMVDISRDKVPTTASLHALIDRLASLKINQLQLYSEHTFAYRNHHDVHAASSPLDAEEIVALDAYCRDRHIELVPNQNCLGHMNRWLAHERYRPLAIAPDGFTDPYGITREPMTIEPNDPRSLELWSASYWPSCCRCSRAAASTSASTRPGNSPPNASTTSCPGPPPSARCPSSRDARC